jgi:hypothetical protein
MATTRKTTARKAAPRKAAAKKTVARKTVAKRSVAAPVATQNSVDAVRDTIASVAREADDTVKQYTAVATEQFADALEFVRGVVDISVGIPFVVQARIADNAALPKLDGEAAKALLDDMGSVPSVDFDAVKAFLDEAKGEGHARIAGVQSRIEPLVDSLRARYAA